MVVVFFFTSDRSGQQNNQLGMVEQVRQNLEKANQRVYGRGKALRFHDVPPTAEISQEAVDRK
jgi:hypothetical protein